jgi:hypothetical protein
MNSLPRRLSHRFRKLSKVPALGSFARLIIKPLLVITLLISALISAAVNAQSGVVPASFPSSFKASFVLNARGLDIGVTHWALSSLEDGRYLYTLHSEATGIAKLFRDERIDESSEWRFENGRVRPLRYSYSREGGKRDRKDTASFDWDKARATYTRDGQTREKRLAEGTLDKLNYMLALMNDLAHGMRETQYLVADNGKKKTYQLKVVGEERIQTVVGELQTIIVERTREGKDRLTRVWCAPELAYLPVRIEHIEHDGTLDFTLTKLEGFDIQ